MLLNIYKGLRKKFKCLYFSSYLGRMKDFLKLYVYLECIFLYPQLLLLCLNPFMNILNSIPSLLERLGILGFLPIKVTLTKITSNL